MGPESNRPSFGLGKLLSVEKSDAGDDPTSDAAGEHTEGLDTAKALDRLSRMLGSRDEVASIAADIPDVPDTPGVSHVPDIPVINDELSDAEAARAELQQALVDSAERHDAAMTQALEETARSQAALKGLESGVSAQIETAVQTARAEAESELTRALEDQQQKHERAVLAIREEAKPVEARDEPVRTADLAKEHVDSLVRDARTLTEAEFASRYAADAERHSETLAKMRHEAERIESQLSTLQDEMAERLQRVRQEAQAAQLAKAAEVEARAETTIAQLHKEVDERVKRVRQESVGRHAAEVEQGGGTRRSEPGPRAGRPGPAPQRGTVEGSRGGRTASRLNSVTRRLNSRPGSRPPRLALRNASHRR